jgi:hypothetical protein
VTSVGKGAFSSTDLEDNPEIRADIERRFGKAPFEYY